MSNPLYKGNPVKYVIPLSTDMDGNPSTPSGPSNISVVKDSWEGSATVTRNFDVAMTGISISNDGDSDLTFTIDGLTITVKPGEVFDDSFAPFNTVMITTTVPYRAVVKGLTDT